MNPADETEFPLPYALKVMGRNEDAFEAFVLEIFNRHGIGIEPEAVSRRPSRDGNYISVNVPFIAASRLQLEALFQELRDHPRVLMVL